MNLRAAFVDVVRGPSKARLRRYGCALCLLFAMDHEGCVVFNHQPDDYLCPFWRPS